MSVEQKSSSSSNKTFATTAFLLGWSVAEMFGHLRKGTRPPSQSVARASDYAPRLVVSNGAAEKSMDAFCLAAQRVAQFYRELGFEPDDKASATTKKIFALPQEVEEWLTGKSAQFTKPKELRELLNSWSMGVWARLDAVSAESARAFTAGMSIADTFWYLRPPTQRSLKAKSHVSQEDWQRLLSKSRLDAERSRLQSLEANLPRYTVAVIKRHLSKWSIGGRVVYQGQQPTLSKIAKPPTILAPKDEAKLQQALARQMQNWDAMLFGLREATTFLRNWDCRFIAFGRRIGLFLVLLATAIILVSITALISYYLSTSLVPGVVQFLNEKQAKVSEWVTVVNLLWTALIAVPVPFVLRQVFQATRGIQQWLDDQLTIFFIARRTYVPWNRYLVKQEKGTKPNGE